MAPLRSLNSSAWLVLLAALYAAGQKEVAANNGVGGLGNIVNGLTDAVSQAASPVLGSNGVNGILGSVPNVLNSAGGMLGGVTKPVLGMLSGGAAGSAAQIGQAAAISQGQQLAGKLTDPITSAVRAASSSLGGLTSGLAAGAGLNVVPEIGNSAAQAAAFEGANMVANMGAGPDMAVAQQQQQVHNSIVNHQAMRNSELVNNAAANALASANVNAVAAKQVVGAEHAAALGASNQLAYRQTLAADALNNAQAESAVAGADMVAHGANNARSASLASNAYRQAKLASARDRVNVAGTIQNSARISDAAIATHDAATKAEDSLLGSELAVDSASTVLDSDGAYIPPVTSSLLRSLPYGRLGIRNIVPKPLTYPSVFLPDVWLNGNPVNYLNVPFKPIPYYYGMGGYVQSVPGPWAAHQFAGVAAANGALISGQPLIANNGVLLNGMVFDPMVAYLTGHLNGALGSSVLPILANGKLEAQDEIANANLITMQQQHGAGMSATYHGYGRNNPVPMITGSVSDANLVPTTTIGTTYPIGSALVIEPRDSFFQDYIDNASSRKNFDERQQ